MLIFFFLSDFVFLPRGPYAVLEFTVKNFDPELTIPSTAVTNNQKVSGLTQLYYLMVLKVRSPKWVLSSFWRL